MSKYYTLKRILPSAIMCVILFELTSLMNDFISVLRLEVFGSLFMLYITDMIVNRIYKYLKENVVYQSFDKSIVKSNIKQLMHSFVFFRIYFIVNMIHFRIMMAAYRDNLSGRDFVISLGYIAIFLIVSFNIGKIQYSRTLKDYKDLTYRYFGIKI